jgi:hypothetical protein
MTSFLDEEFAIQEISPHAQLQQRINILPGVPNKL